MGVCSAEAGSLNPGSRIFSHAISASAGVYAANDMRQQMSDRPYHDSCSHGSLRYIHAGICFCVPRLHVYDSRALARFIRPTSAFFVFTKLAPTLHVHTGLVRGPPYLHCKWTTPLTSTSSNMDLLCLSSGLYVAHLSTCYIFAQNLCAILEKAKAAPAGAEVEGNDKRRSAVNVHAQYIKNLLMGQPSETQAPSLSLAPVSCSPAHSVSMSGCLSVCHLE